MPFEHVNTLEVHGSIGTHREAHYNIATHQEVLVLKHNSNTHLKLLGLLALHFPLGPHSLHLELPNTVFLLLNGQQ